MRRMWSAMAGVSALVGMAIAPAMAQTAEVKEKPPMYSYVANWSIPRGQWGEMDKQTASDNKASEKAFAEGTLVGYGDDVNLVHQPDGMTHDSWFSSMSMAGVIAVLEQAYKSGSTTAPVLSAATKHADGIYVSRYYNWHSGSWKGVYTRVAAYTLKPGVPNDAVDTLAKNLFVPMLEKLLADGAIHEYEIDQEAIHTDDPGAFWVDIIAVDAAGLDKFNALVRENAKTNPLMGPGFASMVDVSKHRDYLSRTNVTYK